VTMKLRNRWALIALFLSSMFRSSFAILRPEIRPVPASLSFHHLTMGPAEKVGDGAAPRMAAKASTGLGLYQAAMPKPDEVCQTCHGGGGGSSCSCSCSSSCSCNCSCSCTTCAASCTTNCASSCVSCVT